MKEAVEKDHHQDFGRGQSEWSFSAGGHRCNGHRGQPAGSDRGPEDDLSLDVLRAARIDGELELISVPVVRSDHRREKREPRQHRDPDPAGAEGAGEWPEARSSSSGGQR